MKISKSKKISTNLTISNINEEIFVLKKLLINLKIQKKGKGVNQNHLFQETRRIIAYLNFKKSLLKKKNKNNI
jgi:ribosomal protein L29